MSSRGARESLSVSKKHIVRVLDINQLAFQLDKPSPAEYGGRPTKPARGSSTLSGGAIVELFPGRGVGTCAGGSSKPAATGSIPDAPANNEEENDIPSPMSESSRIGKIAEHKFCALGFENNLYGNIVPELRYDVVATWGRGPEAGKTLKIQVKSREPDKKFGHRSDNEIVVRFKDGYNNRKPYIEGEIDALVIYVPSLDIWLWFDPPFFVGKASLHIRLNPYTKRYKNRNHALVMQDFIWPKKE